MVKSVKAVKAEPTEYTLQHIGKIRTFTIDASKILKIHKGTRKINHPSLGKSLIVTPGSIITVDQATGKMLLGYKRDFQKYGIESL